MRTLFAVSALALACLASAQANTDPLINFTGSSWIWSEPPPHASLESLAGGVVYFRLPVVLPHKQGIKSAEILAAADNMFTLYLNGKACGESENWSQPVRINIASLLKPGTNTLAIEAANTAMGPAGLVAKLVITLKDGQRVEIRTDSLWKYSTQAETNWISKTFDDREWHPAYVSGPIGMAPWGEIKQIPAKAASPRSGQFIKVPDNFVWPKGGIAFIGDDCSLYSDGKSGPGSGSLGVTVFTARKSRAFPEFDLPCPIKTGRKLFLLRQVGPDPHPDLLLDAGKGAIGTPACSFDGKRLFLSMALDGDPFFHIYSLPASGGKPVRLTNGPFHDIDPSELPDGRIVFTSTRIGTFEEYHNPPSRALFTMSPDGSNIHPLTHTFTFDNEARVMADGRLLFIRSDNFFDRGKVETLLSAIHPDGSHGFTEFGLENAPEYGGRLRAFYCGSPAPMPDGRVAFVSRSGISVGRPGSSTRNQANFGIDAGDVAALPDGRLLCSLGRDGQYRQVGILDPDSKTADDVPVVFQSSGMNLHSPIYVGPRPKPPILAGLPAREASGEVNATGFLFCQNARFTQNTTAGWSHVRAIRVIAGKGLTLRSSHSYIVHAGNETVELGTFPLAPDGSFSVEVPANTALAFQAVDAEGRSELNEMSWIFVKPGEHRSCLGCHQQRQVAPLVTSTRAQALQAPPLKLTGQGEPHRFRGNNPAVTGLMELQFDRFREVAGLNRYAEAPSLITTRKTDINTLVTQLRGNHDDLRISAAQRLGLFRDQSAEPALAEALTNQCREVRVAVAMALASCGTRGSVPPLLNALSDLDPLVAQAASVALENLTGHTEPFTAFAPPETRSAQTALWTTWFIKTDWHTIEQELIQRLGSSDPSVVRRAAVALGHTGGPAACRKLRESLSKAREVNPLPEWRRIHHGDGAQFNSLSPVNPRTVQALARSLGYRRDADAVPLLAETLDRNSTPATGNLFLAEACAEALGRIATPEVGTALVTSFSRLTDYIHYTVWYGDHPALMACHASPLHFFILEALDALESSQAAGIVPAIIRSVPTDFDRALFPSNDDYETLAGRVIRRNDPQSSVTETCLAILGDPRATRAPDIATAIGAVHGAWAGKPTLEIRAAQILSLTCRDKSVDPRIRAALDRYRKQAADDIPRVFSTGIPVVNKLPVKNWVCFFLARTLGHLAATESVETLLALLEQTPPEAASGFPDPTGPGVLFLHNDLTPCYRAEAAWALGRIRDPRATPLLLKVVADLRNAPDTRYAAAIALQQIPDESVQPQIRKLAANYPDIATRRELLRIVSK
jgi:HEAT repeat protein